MLLVAGVLAVTPGRARAQDAQTQAMGRALFNEGMKLFAEGKYEAACPKFEASLKHYPGIGTRGKLAECYEKRGRYVSAWTAYREVAQLAMRSGDPTRQQIASERAKALEPKLSYVTVWVPPANDAPGLVVKREGIEIDRSRFGAAEPIDAGTLAFEVVATGRKPMTAQLVVTPGQSARFEVPALEPLATAAASAQEPSAADADLPPAEEGRSGSSWQKPTGLVVAGLGVAGLAIGGVFGLDARSTYEGAFDDGRCDRSTNQCDLAGQSAVDDARSKATLATLFVAAGAAFTVGGAILFFTAPSSSKHAIRIAPTAHAGGGGLVVGGSL